MTQAIVKAQDYLENRAKEDPMTYDGHRNGFVLVRLDGTSDYFWKQVCYGKISKSRKKYRPDIAASPPANLHWDSDYGHWSDEDGEGYNHWNRDGERAQHAPDQIAAVVTTLASCYHRTKGSGCTDKALGMKMAQDLLKFFSPYLVDGIPHDVPERGFALDVSKVSSLGAGQILISIRNCLEYEFAPTFYQLQELGVDIPQALTLCKALQWIPETNGWSIRNGLGHTDFDGMAYRIRQDQPILEQVDRLGLYTKDRLAGNALGGIDWYNHGLEKSLAKMAGGFEKMLCSDGWGAEKHALLFIRQEKEKSRGFSTDYTDLTNDQLKEML